MENQKELIKLLTQKIAESVKAHSDQYTQIFKKGGKTKLKSPLIKESNVGKFTEYCGGKVTDACIAKGKASKNKKIRKRATFAVTVRTWKHKCGAKLINKKKS